MQRVVLAPVRRPLAATLQSAAIALILAVLALGATTSAVRAQDSGTPASGTCPGACTGDLAAIPASQVAALPVERQVAWLDHAAHAGELEKMSDSQLVDLFESLAPDTLPKYMELGLQRYKEYQFDLYSQQRIHGVWQDQAAHMFVRYREDPRQVYVKWLPDGRNAGQEMIYDEQKNAKELYAHQGGAFSFVSVWTPIDSGRAVAQSNHTVRELSLGFVTELYLKELKKYHAAGVDKPIKTEVLTDHGERVIAFTWETPTGQPDYYAKRSRLGLNLRHPYFSTSESWDNDGVLFEKFTFLNVKPEHFDALAFDPKNPDYKF